MTDHPLPEDDSARYVLGELTSAQRREFEARMAQSVDLRALVRELEEGMVALSMASPPRRAPQEVWTRIEKAMDREQRRKIREATRHAQQQVKQEMKKQSEELKKHGEEMKQMQREIKMDWNFGTDSEL